MGLHLIIFHIYMSEILKEYLCSWHRQVGVL